MTLRQLECFLHLSENLNFARTAEELYISQPSVSREIQSLETELGIILFERTKRSVSLTVAGRSFKEDLLPLYSRFNAAIIKARNCQKKFYQQLNIGYCHEASLSLLPEGLRQFHTLHPNVYLCPISGELRQLNASFISGNLDVVFGMKCALTPTEQDGFERLYKGYLCVYVPIGHPLDHYRKINIQNLNGHTIILGSKKSSPSYIESILREIIQQCPNSILSTVPSVEISMLLKAGLGISIAPQYSLPPSPTYRMIPLDYSELPISDSIDYYICYHKGNLKKHIRRFVSIMQGLYENKQWTNYQ